MVELHRFGDFFPRRVNQYVPQMRYSADVGKDGIYRVSLGSPVAGGFNTILDGVDIVAAGGDGTRLDISGLAVGAAIAGGVVGAIGTIADANFGRNVTGAGLTNPLDILIEGFDYLGQPMQEQVTAAATLFNGVKAFKEVTAVTFTDGGDADCDIGFGNVMGLPYMTQAIIAGQFNGAPDVVAAFVAGIRTDPQTAATADPRGTHDGTAAPNGSEWVITGLADGFVNAAGNGGLHGIRHFGG